MLLNAIQERNVVGIILSVLNSSFLADTWTCLFIVAWAMTKVFSDFKN